MESFAGEAEAYSVTHTIVVSFNCCRVNNVFEYLDEQFCGERAQQILGYWNVRKRQRSTGFKGLPLFSEMNSSDPEITVSKVIGVPGVTFGMPVIPA